MSARKLVATTALLLSVGALSTVAQPEIHRNVRTGNVAVQLTVLHRSEYGFNGSNFFHCNRGEC